MKSEIYIFIISVSILFFLSCNYNSKKEKSIENIEDSNSYTGYFDIQGSEKKDLCQTTGDQVGMTKKNSNEDFADSLALHMCKLNKQVKEEFNKLFNLYKLRNVQIDKLIKIVANNPITTAIDTKEINMDLNEFRSISINDELLINEIKFNSLFSLLENISKETSNLILIIYKNELKNDTYNNIEKELSKNKGGINKLDIGITLTAGGYFIPEILNVFKRKYPELRFNFHTDHATNLIERMRLNELDFIIVDGTPQTTEFNVELLVKDELIIIGPKNHPLANKSVVTTEELKKEKFILRHEKANTRLAFENYLLNHLDNIANFDVILEIDNTALIKQLIIAGHGLSVMSRAICEVNLRVGTLKEIKLKDFYLERGIYLVYPNDLKNTDLIKNIISLKE